MILRSRSVAQFCRHVQEAPTGLFFPDCEIIALRRQQLHAGLEHQSALCGGSGVGWADRAGHVQPWGSRGDGVQALEHEQEKGAPATPGATHTSISSAKRSAADDHGLISVCLLC